MIVLIRNLFSLLSQRIIVEEFHLIFRPPIFGFETATELDPRLKDHFNDQGACIPIGKRIKSVHYKPNKKAIINRRKTREPMLADLSSKCNPLAAKLFPNSLKMKSDLYGQVYYY